MAGRGFVAEALPIDTSNIKGASRLLRIYSGIRKIPMDDLAVRTEIENP